MSQKGIRMESGNLVTERRGIVFYDGNCSLCRKSVAILQRLDWFHRLTYWNARDADQLPESLDRSRLLEEMHLITPRQGIYAGFWAFRWTAGRLPLLWPVWPLLFLP